MKTLKIIALCAAAALAAPAFAQDSSKAGSSGYDVVDLATRFAKRTGKSVVVDPRVRSSVPLAGLNPDQLTYEQLLAILDVQQIAVVESGGVLALVPDANARQLPTAVYTDVNFKASDHELVTLLYTTKNLCAAHLVPVLRPLMPQAAHLAAETQTNTLIINDHAANVRRIAALAEQLDKRSSGKKECPNPNQSWTQPQPVKPAPAG